MTASDMPSRIAMPCPFAKNGTLGTIDNTSSTNMNYSDGFPTVYGAPSANSGKFVTRGEINRLGNIATNDMFYLKCGGLNTYDANFAQAIGGYPKGAVVIYLTEARELFYAISLVDNNLANLNETHNDNINWAYLNQDDAKVDTNSTVEVATMYFNSVSLQESHSSGYVTAGYVYPAQVFKAKYTGSVSIKSGVTFSSRAVSGITNVTNVNGLNSFGLMIKDLGTSEPASIDYPSGSSFNGWEQIVGGVEILNNATSISQAITSDTFSGIVTVGHYYGITPMMGFAKIAFSSSSGSVSLTDCNGGTVSVNVIRFSY